MDTEQKNDISRRDLEILNAKADQFNREALDTLSYQVSIEDMLEEIPET